MVAAAVKFQLQLRIILTFQYEQFHLLPGTNIPLMWPIKSSTNITIQILHNNSNYSQGFCCV